MINVGKMSDETYKILLGEIESKNYYTDYIEENNIYKLFTIYLINEIKDTEDLYKFASVKSMTETSFYRFMWDNLSKINVKYDECFKFGDGYKKSNPEDIVEKCVSKMMVDFFQSAGFRGGSKYKSDKKFVSVVSNNLKKDDKLLDVGSGTIVPYTSMLFAKDYGCVDSMDKFESMYLPFIKSMNVNPISDFLTQDSNVSKYTFFTGRRPCSAIAPIVNKCAKINLKPRHYFLEICNCDVRHVASNNEEFVELLKTMDKRLKFFYKKASVKNREITYDYSSNWFEGENFKHLNTSVYVTNLKKHPDDIMSDIINAQLEIGD